VKFFTRQWARGGLSEAETERIREAYSKHARSIADFLPTSIARLQVLNLHDALIQFVEVRRSRHELSIDLVCGDLQHGYSDISLLFTGVDWSSVSLDSLRQVALEPETELLYDEVDLVASGRYAHRILFWPRGEVEIVFEGLHLKELPRPPGAGRSLASRPTRYQEQ
jgi:hypothetical protein